jgi:hypothetical protein
MARAKWSKYLPSLMKLGAVFVAIGFVWGLLRGDGALIGALAGLLLFALTMGIGAIVELIKRLRGDPW